MNRLRTKRLVLALVIGVLAVPLFAQNGPDYAQRRQRLMAQLEAGSVAIIRNHQPAHRSNDGDYFPFRSNSDFFYLTGSEEPGSTLVLTPGGRFPVALFVKPENARTIQWFGEVPGVKGAMETLGADTAFAVADFDRLLLGLVSTKSKVYFEWEDEELFDQVRSAMKNGHRSEPRQFMDITPLIHEMRVIKDDWEVAQIRHSVDILCEAHREAMRVLQPDMAEHEINAVFSYILEKRGSKSKSFESIVASGPNASVYHYSGLDRVARSGELVMIDMGAEYGNYASDVTRVLPVDGRFSPEQKAVYDIVLKMENAMIDHLKPGNRFQDAINKALDIARAGCFELGLTLDKDSPWQYLLYVYPYIAHGMGLDVHDVGNYGSFRDGGRVLEPNMVFAVEPLIYVGENLVDAFRMDVRRQFNLTDEEVDAFLTQIKPVFDRYVGVAIRIEDDVLITENGNEVLSAQLPRTAEAIEKAMKEKSRLPR